jgi:beta-lactamase superfamily II metal-dependent hydrolase
MQPTQTTDVLVFDVGMGQSIFIYPHDHPEYGMMIDCGHEGDFHPVNFLLENNLLPGNVLSNLTLTNYDHDHFSGIVNLRSKVHIKTVSFANNLTSQEIAAEKPQHTDHLAHVYDIKAKYTANATDYTPPYIKHIYRLEKEDLDVYDTNNLSQAIFRNGITPLDSILVF